MQVKVQQARQELNEQNHAYDPERIGDAVANADAAAGSPGQAFRGGRKRRSAGAGPRKDAGGNTRRHIEPDAAQAGEQGGNAHNYGGHHGQFAALLGDGGKEAVACAQPLSLIHILGKHPGIAYVKWDCDRKISDPGSAWLDARHQGNLAIDYVRGYESVLDALAEEFSQVVFQACSSGGGRADYGTMRRHHEFWTSDNTDACERVFMQWSIGHLFPAISMGAHVTASPNHQTGRAVPLKFRFDAAMAARLGFELQDVYKRQSRSWLRASFTSSGIWFSMAAAGVPRRGE